MKPDVKILNNELLHFKTVFLYLFCLIDSMCDILNIDFFLKCKGALSLEDNLR